MILCALVLKQEENIYTFSKVIDDFISFMYKQEVEVNAIIQYNYVFFVSVFYQNI